MAAKPATRKAQRNDATKWTLTSDEFTDEVVPLARELAGTLAPWEGLTVKHIQDIVDKVYPEAEHEVTPESAWVGLVRRSPCLSGRR